MATEVHFATTDPKGLLDTSRAAAEAVLANCQIKIFLTSDPKEDGTPDDLASVDEDA
ncbi:hypothetical protein PZT66_24110 [Pseudomonas aeruginosa]|uniref:hypothetical protein n=1 Tax=Pseudomonas aeruginosa group TaxID=136841 RepID=UPI000B1A1568|nr:hypothetical protein [Pseudomonas aeruginosa]EIU2716085.1 hypothetical protein [Pseudomonas aeruginosa]EIU2863624.1 hypothetical protein [Pseudomonas aeruginosa]ELD5772836.1 hypothetical protein [Pseudomonas aeruginosa]MBA5210172.1 hypothetical protein [Pseudomonas aeruginosa]MBG3917575.1 hypothetical protein [Pseudomonas aeruginosa]